MNKRNIVRFAVATLWALLLAAPLLAQEGRQGGQERTRITREINGRPFTFDAPVMKAVTEANFEQYRSDLVAIILAQKDVAKMLRLEDKTNELLDPILQQLSAQKYSDIPPNYPGFPDLSALRSAVLNQQQVLAQAFANAAGRVANYLPTDPFPGAQYALNLCPLNPQPPEVAFAVGAALLVAQLVREIAQNVCNETILAFVFGGNFSIACVVTDLIYAALRLAYFPIKFCDDDTVGGELKGSNERTVYIKDLLYYSIDNDNKNKAMLSTQLTNAENHIVTNDNNNKAALSNQTATFQTLSVRGAIERNLTADPATVAGVGLFQLPASRGGYLEVARQILIDTYNAQVAAAVAAGQLASSIYNPSTELSLGATYTSQGKYREAYYYYRKGFRSVVKYP